jgi:hypothetical protein
MKRACPALTFVSWLQSSVCVWLFSECSDHFCWSWTQLQNVPMFLGWTGQWTTYPTGNTLLASTDRQTDRKSKPDYSKCGRWGSVRWGTGNLRARYNGKSSEEKPRKMDSNYEKYEAKTSNKLTAFYKNVLKRRSQMLQIHAITKPLKPYC